MDNRSKAFDTGQIHSDRCVTSKEPCSLSSMQMYFETLKVAEIQMLTCVLTSCCLSGFAASQNTGAMSCLVAILHLPVIS